MNIKELSINDFSDFANMHPLTSYCQTINYAILMSEHGFEYDLIGYVDNDDNIVAASLILLKSINKVYYGYAPKGFLIDYDNFSLMKQFTDDLAAFYYKKHVAFIKINPEIITSKYNNKSFNITYDHKALNIKDFLPKLNYISLKNNLYFESMHPRFNAIVDLNSIKFNEFSKNTRNKIRKSVRKGLSFVKSDNSNINLLNNTHVDSYFYRDFFNIFSKDMLSDFFLIKIDIDSYLENSQNIFLNEQDVNTSLNEKVIKYSNSRNINRKMNSDIKLLSYKKDIMESTKLSESNQEIIIGAVLTVKHGNKVKIISSYYDKSYSRFVPNYFTYYNLIKYYKDKYDYLDLNGISGDFTSSNPLKGLNDFKLGFNPSIFENIGEFDLIIEPKAYKYLLKNNLLNKEFKTKF